jgi:hypothetical protein
MGFFLEFDAPSDTVRVVFDAIVTTEDIGGNVHAALRTFVSEHPQCQGIADFSHVKQFDVPSHVIRDRARLPPAMPSGKLFVMVAPQDHIFGLSRMFASFADQSRPHIRVVRTMDEAYRLLEIRDPNFQPLQNGATGVSA